MKIALIFTLLFSIKVLSNEVKSTLETLGHPISDIDILLSAYCYKNWQVNVPNTQLKDNTTFVYRGLQSGMFNVYKQGDTHSMIKAGENCSNLWEYYFNGYSNNLGIKNFIDSDNKFIIKYHYSSIDFWGLNRYKSASLNGLINQDVLRYWKKLASKGLISITKENTTFNNKESEAYLSAITDKGKKLLQTIHRSHPSQ